MNLRATDIFVGNQPIGLAKYPTIFSHYADAIYPHIRTILSNRTFCTFTCKTLRSLRDVFEIKVSGESGEISIRDPYSSSHKFISIHSIQDPTFFSAIEQIVKKTQAAYDEFLKRESIDSLNDDEMDSSADESDCDEGTFFDCDSGDFPKEAFDNRADRATEQPLNSLQNNQQSLEQTALFIKNLEEQLIKELEEKKGLQNRVMQGEKEVTDLKRRLLENETVLNSTTKKLETVYVDKKKFKKLLTQAEKKISSQQEIIDLSQAQDVETITHLKEQLRILSDEKKALEQEVILTKTSQKESHKELQEKDAFLNDIKNALKAKTETVNQFSMELTQLQKSLTQAQKIIGSQQEIIDTFSKEQGEISHLKEELRLLRDEKKTLEKEAFLAETSQKELYKELQQKGAFLNEIKNALKAKTEKADQLSIELSKLKESLAQAQKTIGLQQQTIHAFDKQEKEISQLKKAIADLEEQLRILDEEKDALQQESILARNLQKKLNEELEKKTLLLNEIQAALSTKTERVNQLSMQLTKSEESLTQAQKIIGSQQEGEISEFKKVIADLKEQLRLLKEEKEHLQMEKEEHDHMQRTLEQVKQALEETNPNFEGLPLSEEITATNPTQSYDQLLEHIRALRSMIYQAKRKKTKTKEESEKLKEKIRALHSLIETQTQQIEEQTRIIEEKTSEIQLTQTRSNHIFNKIQEKDAEFNEQTKIINRLNAEIEENMGEIIDLKASVEKLNNHILELNNRIDTLNKEKSTLNKENEALKDENEAFKNETKDLQKEMSDLKKEIEQYKEKVEEDELEITNFLKKNSDLKAELSRKKEEFDHKHQEDKKKLLLFIYDVNKLIKALHDNLPPNASQDVRNLINFYITSYAQALRILNLSEEEELFVTQY